MSILECQVGLQNPVQVLKEFKNLQILVVNHFGDADDIHMLEELSCKFIIYLDKLNLSSIGIQKLVPVLESLKQFIFPLTYVVKWTRLISAC